MWKDDRNNSLWVIIAILFILMCLMGSLIFVYKCKTNSLVKKVTTFNNELVQIENRWGDLIESSDKEVITVKIIDKEIVEYRKPYRRTSSNLMFTGFYWLPMSSSDTYYEDKTKFTIRLSDVEGYKPSFDISSKKYETLSIGDEIKVAIYRNNDLSKFEPIAGENIVSISLQE